MYLSTSLPAKHQNILLPQLVKHDCLKNCKLKIKSLWISFIESVFYISFHTAQEQISDR